MKYSGTANWLYENGKYDTASVITDVTLPIIQGSYVYKNFNYHFKLTESKPGFYAGSIFDGSNECGTAFFWKYSNGVDIVLQGKWEEYENSDCYILLKPI